MFLAFRRCTKRKWSSGTAKASEKKIEPLQPPGRFFGNDFQGLRGFSFSREINMILYKLRNKGSENASMSSIERKGI